MRQALNRQLQLGQIDVPAIQFDLDSRDDIPQVLRGLQEVFLHTELRDDILRLLDGCLPAEVSRTDGRPGLDHWSTLVLGVLRLALNCDYDRIQELANEHRTLRQMLGHGWLDEDKRYGRTTILDNVSRITPEVLSLVNWVVVKYGHHALGQEDPVLRGRCDSFVVETDVEYPTDAGLLVVAVRKALQGCAQAQELGLPGAEGWRQSAYLIQTVRNLCRQAQKLRPLSNADEDKAAARQEAIREAYQALLDRCDGLIARAAVTLEAIAQAGPDYAELHEEVALFLSDARRQQDQLHRRVILGERIPHAEKVFSLFERHTEWISKGKAGVPVELGVRVAILEDQFGFCLTHRVMSGEIDEEVAVKIVEDGQLLFPQLRACSFDKGFWSPENRLCLEARLDDVVLPKKGKWSAADREREEAETFVAMRRQHPAVESAIHALEVHGLDRCPDHGLDGFKRYVAWAVLGRNLIQLGAIRLGQERERRRRQEARRRAA